MTTLLATRTATTEAIAHRVRMRSRLLAAWATHLWSAGQSSLDQGLAITAAEVDRLLRDPADEQTHKRLFFAQKDAPGLAEAADAADAALREDPAWSGLVRDFELSGTEADLLCLLAAVEIDPRLRRVMAFLQDDARAVHPTAALAAELFGNQAAAPMRVENLLRWRLAHPLDGAAAWAAPTAWQADASVVLSIAAGEWIDPRLDGICELIPPDRASAFPCLYPETLEALLARDAQGETALAGPRGTGRKTLAAQYACALGKPLLAVDVPALLVVQTPAVESLAAAARMARARRALLYLRDAEALTAADWQNLRLLAPNFVRGAATPPATADRVFELKPLTTAQRILAWSSHSDAAAPEMVLTQRLTPAEIALAAKAAEGGDEAIRAALRRSIPVSTDLLQLLPCPYTWDDLVVSPDLGQKLRDFEAQVRLRWEVYEDWGMQRLTPMGQGVSALFGGPSGTGKTMAAQVLARSLHLDVYRVDLAGVVNKYIGETEKRLREVFDSCERSGALLFFDEADALFGSRMQVKDAHDRFANIEIDYLLQRIEQFNGIAILATNRKNDLDSAFLRRLRFVIEFLPPAPAERLALWQRALLPRSPSGELILGEIDFALLANTIELTGAQIKAIALGAAFLARSQRCRIEMTHVALSAERELAKHGQTLRGPLGKGPQL